MLSSTIHSNNHGVMSFSRRFNLSSMLTETNREDDTIPVHSQLSPSPTLTIPSPRSNKLYSVISNRQLLGFLYFRMSPYMYLDSWCWSSSSLSIVSQNGYEQIMLSEVCTLFDLISFVMVIQHDDHLKRNFVQVLSYPFCGWWFFSLNLSS